MSDTAERSIPATPCRRAAAREEGAAPNAAIPAFVALATAAVLLLPGWFQTALPAAGEYLRESLSTAFAAPHDGSVDLRLLFPVRVLLPSAALVIATAGAGLGVRFLLDGSAWRLARATPRWRRIDPFAGVGRVLSLATLRVVLWNGLCLAVLATAAAFATGPLISLLDSSTPVVDASPALAVLRGMLLPVLLAAAAVATAQWGVTRLAFERRLRMTPEEFREAMRHLEADPKIKFERRNASRGAGG